MVSVADDAGLGMLLEYLRDSRSFDFTGYKRPSLTRRIQRRMQMVGAEDYAAYMSLLEANPDEFAELFDTILINVTGFLRDPEAWSYLAERVIPAIVEERGQEDTIRVWSAATASGEEAYSLAVLLAEAVGEKAFRERVKIYATDADEAALVDARRGQYPTKDVLKAFGEDRAARFFDSDGTLSVFKQELRRSVIFGRHDLVQHPPISRIDLLSCRNTLMYFTSDMQRRVLANFHFALGDNGFLFLGKSEAMVTHSRLFEVVNLRNRIFRRGASSNSQRVPVLDADQPRTIHIQPRSTEDVIRLSFEDSPVAQLVIDQGGKVAAVNRHARSLFGLGIDATGKALKDLQISYRPVELRSIVEDVLSNRRPIAVHDVEWNTPAGDHEYLDVLLLPVGIDGVIGVTITYMQVGRYKLLREELERSQRELETAYEEVQSTVEELETTNEELQSTNEELETTNEELHSTNEELETMNEELHSTNEELESANVELRERSVALDEVNVFLESVLASLRTAVVVLNPDMGVRAWNKRAEDLWGLRAEEVEGSHFLNLDIGLPVDQLRSPIRACLDGNLSTEAQVVTAVNRRGRTIECSVSLTPLKRRGEVLGVILVMDDR